MTEFNAAIQDSANMLVIEEEKYTNPKFEDNATRTQESFPDSKRLGREPDTFPILHQHSETPRRILEMVAHNLPPPIDARMSQHGFVRKKGHHGLRLNTTAMNSLRVSV